jgi:hypothetical protein
MACSLDDAERLSQRERYRLVGAGAELVERSARRLVIALAGDVDRGVVEELVDVERACCPFFTLEFEESARRLAVSVSRESEQPALDAIEFALGLAAADRLAARSRPRHGVLG